MNGVSACMAKFKFEGMDEYITTLGRIGRKQSEKIIKYAVYPGAALVADAIRDALNSHRESGELANSITLATMRNDDGYVNTKIMFAGYDSAKVSKQFPKGVPNAVKAASLESGNSRGEKGTHLISKATKSVTERAIAEMSKALDEKIDQIMGE